MPGTIEECVFENFSDRVLVVDKRVNIAFAIIERNLDELDSRAAGFCGVERFGARDGSVFPHEPTLFAKILDKVHNAATPNVVQREYILFGVYLFWLEK